MAGGLFALLDDVALIAKSAAANIDDVAGMAGKTSVKAAGVVIDDAAVTPQFVSGVQPARELPMIWRITKGSLVNKLAIILPIALLLSWLAPWALTPILMCGGAFLCYEGAHKILHKFLPHPAPDAEAAQASAAPAVQSLTPVVVDGKEAEDKLVRGAITTDLILSAEIMVISLNAVLDQTFAMRVAILIVTAIVLTLGVYGAVGLLVKMDDIGLKLIERHNGKSLLGKGLVEGMPHVLNVIGVIGTAAMLWVGGHIVIKGLHEFGSAQPYEFIHHLTDYTTVGALQWLIDTGCSMVFGFLLGAIIVLAIEVVKRSVGKTSATSAPH